MQTSAAMPALRPDAFCWRLLAAVTAVKLLLMPSYRSTDFELCRRWEGGRRGWRHRQSIRWNAAPRVELFLQLQEVTWIVRATTATVALFLVPQVHRNWLAITASLPPSRWYIEATSPWTLDYPPLFAWFEWALSHAARLADPEMLALDNLLHASDATVWFQRGTVMVTDLLLVAGVLYAGSGQAARQRDTAFALTIASAGLLIVDHIHFQYNGFLLGLLVWSIALVQKQRDIAAAVVFALLLNMKHLFAAAGPVYFVYLLRHYCRGRYAAGNFVKLGAAVAAVFAASFGPFIWMGQLQTVLRRLFPFGRGLTHAYWAPNFWALYAAADRGFAAALPRFGFAVTPQQAGMTGGLVGTAAFAVLPQVTPAATLALVLAAQAPALSLLWRRPQPAAFADAVVYSLLSAFVFGFHVHEKAILTAVVPMALGAARSRTAAAEFLFLAAAGHQGLLPLLHQAREWPIKVALTAVYFLGAQALLVATTAGGKKVGGAPLPLAAWQRAYLWGLIPLELYCAFGHQLVCYALFGGPRLPFLPLLLTSVYCAVGVLWAWAVMAGRFLRQQGVDEPGGGDRGRLKAS